jgi:UDPglucose 6-dehydrogenase
MLNVCIVGPKEFFMKLGVIGCGVVGSAVALGFERLGHSVVRHDLKLETRIESVLGCDIVFICVPTPPAPDGQCDTRIVEEVVAVLADWHYRGIVAIKSTVKPGTTQRLLVEYGAKTAPGVLPVKAYCPFQDICFVPEFLRERSAFYDFTEGHDVLAVGTHNICSYNLIVEAHGKYPKQRIQMAPTEAELLKYYSNTYNALRVTWANAFYEVCKKMGADYAKVKDAFIKRGTATDMYLDCNDNLRGFAGTCLSKDPKALASLATELGIPAQLFNVIISDNELYKKTVFEGMRL